MTTIVHWVYLVTAVANIVLTVMILRRVRRLRATQAAVDQELARAEQVTREVTQWRDLNMLNLKFQEVRARTDGQAPQ